MTARRRLARAAGGAAVAALLAAGCASGGRRSFSRPTAERESEALRSWTDSLARAGPPGNVNVLYDATLSQGLLRTGGTLAVRLREDRVEGTLAGPFGTPIATYSDGELRGEKLRPVFLPPGQLRAVLAGSWVGALPTVAGQSGETVLLRWSGTDAAEGVFDVSREELLSVRVERPEGRLEARFSGSRNPWPDRIEIQEERSGSRLELRLLSREIVS